MPLGRGVRELDTRTGVVYKRPTADMRKWMVILTCAAGLALGQDPEPPTGLRVTYRAGGVVDTMATPHVALYVPAGRSATPFLPPGRFVATWEGVVKIDLRGDYSFQASGRGSLKLEVNNTVLLDLPGLSALGKPATTKSVRLNKGPNAIKVTYTSPSRGDAQLRLFWSDRPDKPMPHEPIRAGQLAHEANPALEQADLRRAGRELFLEARCIRCHKDGGEGGIPSLAMSGPDFSTIGDRRHPAWMAQWILNPKAHRATARMPRLLHGENAEADALAIAGHLATLKADPPPPAVEYPEPDLEAGMELVEKLNCAGCHNLPGAEEPAKDKLNLSHINQKYPLGQLRDFLRAPNAHYVWTRMPTFEMSSEEAWNIASWLRSQTPLRPEPLAVDVAEAKRGEELMTKVGCLNCHSHPAENQFKAPPLADLASPKWMGGCLTNAPDADSRAPRYDFSVAERAALRAFAATDRHSLKRHVPTEFAARQSRLLNCNACHGELEGFPELAPLGEKLRPEWMEQLFAGKLKQRPRPWLGHRMPAFPVRSKNLAHGLSMSHGLPPVSPKPPPVKPELVETGRMLVGVDGGFSCVACHGVKGRDPLQVFEAQGVNFARVGDRLQSEFFLRWMLDPLRVDSQSRMPDYFDEDARSVLVDVLEGDAAKQIDAIRHYLLQGNKMKIPVMQ